MEHMGEMLGGATALGALSWVMRRAMNATDVAKKDADTMKKALESEIATLRAEVSHVKEEVSVLKQQVSGPGFGLTTVVGRLADAVEKLDTVVTRIDARMEAAR
jgi:hypothetical protein